MTHCRAAGERLAEELGRADLGDIRLARRLQRMVQRATTRPSASFPNMARNEAELEATYRWLNNPRVTLDSILEPHYQATAHRTQSQDVLVVHDTTQFCFPGDVERKGLGRVSNSGQGFFGHFALAFADDAICTPLGIIGLRTVFRPPVGAPPGSPKESERWLQLVDDVSSRLSPRGTIHLMDREGDWAKLFIDLQQRQARFVIRLSQNRRLEHSEKRLFASFDDQPDLLEREVELAARSDRGRRLNAKKLHPARATRIARVGLSARAVALRVGGQQPIQLNVVRVLERHPPAGQSPVSWWLATSEPIRDAADLARIVDLYRARWAIEEFFKALKSGCRFEQRQLESHHALLAALGLLAPVAWQMLALRSLSRLQADAPATTVLTQRQLRVLKACARRPLSKDPTVTEALFAIAALGGHLRRNGPPGWSTLGLGMTELLLFEAGWSAHEAQM